MARGEVLSAEEKELIIQLCREGLTYRAIGLKMNPVRSHTVVRNYNMKRESYGIKKMGRKPKNPEDPWLSENQEKRLCKRRSYNFE